MSNIKTESIEDERPAVRRRGEGRVRELRWHRDSAAQIVPLDDSALRTAAVPRTDLAPTPSDSAQTELVQSDLQQAPIEPIVLTPVGATEESMRAGGVNELMAPQNNVQRIMWTGTAWFAVAVGSVALAIGPLLSSGWRPGVLPEPIQILWWVGALVVTLSIGLIGWSGCPILEVDVPTSDRNKTRTMQFGTALFILGSAAALLAVLLGPVP